MLDKFEAAELGRAQSLLTLFDARTQDAIDSFLQTLPVGARAKAQDAIDDGRSNATQMWHRIRDGPQAGSGNRSDGDGGGDDPLQQQRQLGSAAAGLVADAGSEDPEHPFASTAGASPHTQRALARIVDEATAEGIREHYRNSGAYLDNLRLDDLAHPENNHCWLWALCKQQQENAIEDREEFIEAVRMRLGAGGPADGSVCGLCGKFLDRAGAHATCCPIGESTKGHHALRDVVFSYALLADSSAELEPEHLIPSRPRDRPADVLTAAVPGCVAALDIGVAAPAAAAAGDDAAEAMWKRKLDEREGVRPELEQAGIRYRPFVFTAYGRPHAAASEAIRHIAKRAATRKGWAGKALERQLRCAIAIALARRLARMPMSTWHDDGG